MRRAFVEHSFDLHVADCLQRGAEAGSSEDLAQLVICYGERLDAKDHDGSTALHAAAASGNVDAVILLLDARAALDAVTNCGESPLHLANREGHTAVCRLLKEAWNEAGRGTSKAQL